ncbi:MAG TPA: glycosyltransferase family protein [Victivallales bacterium]|nr:glycosyltransferase family protein [Victivallales bacterium]
MKKGVLAIIQARMGSSRLPGKMALPIIHGKGALELMVERVRKSKTIGKLMVATTTNPSDDKLVEICSKINIGFFRGSEEDVLDRFYQAYKSSGSNFDSIVRLTGDCPLHDPAVIDKVVSEFLNSDSDYVSNVDPPSYPDGLDTEVFSSAALHKAWSEANMKSEREHVTIFIRNSGIFKKSNVTNETDISYLRWTLDEESDYVMIKKVYENLYDSKQDFGTQDVIRLLSAHPEIVQINSKINRNEGLLKSLKNDKKVKI